MARLTLAALDPSLMDWATWAGSVVVDLQPSYNLPNPGDEGSWQSWAIELLNIPGIADLGLPDPRPFGESWQGWAVAFILTAV